MLCSLAYNLNSERRTNNAELISIKGVAYNLFVLPQLPRGFFAAKPRGRLTPNSQLLNPKS